MYELLNIKNKFKGKRFYYCSFRDYAYSSTPTLRRIFIRLVTYVGDNMILVGENFRIEIPMKELVTNRSFSMRVKNKHDFDWRNRGFEFQEPWRIISTEKQEVARFIKDYYCTSLQMAWGDSVSAYNQQKNYKTLIEQLKRL